MVQMMPKYQEALQHATDHDYSKAMVSLKEALQEVEAQIGPNTNFHLFLHQKIASLQVMDRDILAVEETFKKCIEISENAAVPLNSKLDQAQNIFMWQNNLLKFYIENDIEKAISYGRELIEEVG